MERLKSMVHGDKLVLSKDDDYHIEIYYLNGFYIVFTMQVTTGEMSLESTYHKSNISQCTGMIRDIIEFG